MPWTTQPGSSQLRACRLWITLKSGGAVDPSVGIPRELASLPHHPVQQTCCSCPASWPPHRGSGRAPALSDFWPGSFMPKNCVVPGPSWFMYCRIIYCDGQEKRRKSSAQPRRHVRPQPCCLSLSPRPGPDHRHRTDTRSRCLQLHRHGKKKKPPCGQQGKRGLCVRLTSRRAP